MKTKRLFSVLAVLLSVVVTVCSVPNAAYAAELIGVDEEILLVDETISADSIAEEVTLADSVSDEAILANSVSDDDIIPDVTDEIAPVAETDDLGIASDGLGSGVDFIFYVGDGCGYAYTPDGYWFNGEDAYFAESSTKITPSATVKTLGDPYWTPKNKQFIGWESVDGKWGSNSGIPLSLLPSIKDGEEYMFTAIYKDYRIAYNTLNSGKINSGCFMYPDYPTAAVDGLDAEEKATYKLLTAANITPNSPDLVFTGWEELDGTKYSDLSEYNFEEHGMNIVLAATFNKVASNTLALTGLTGIDEASVNALKNQGFTVNGDTATLKFTEATSKFYLPEISKFGYDFVGWYETGKDPGTASPYVEFNPAAATGKDVSYTALLKEGISVSLRSDLTLYQGQSFKFRALVSPEGTSQNVIWGNSDSTVAKLTGNVVKGLNEGITFVTATSMADPSKSATCKVTVLKSEVTETDEHGEPIDPGSYAMDKETGEMNIWVAGLDKDGYHYTGKAIKPEIHVYNGGALLQEGIDYTLSYKDNVKVSATKPQISIKMKGRYAGTEVAHFEIVPTSVEDLTAKDDALIVSYNKKKNQLKPTLMYQGKEIKVGRNDIAFKWFETDTFGSATDVESDCVEPGLYAVKVYAGASGNFTSSASGYQIATIAVQGDHGKIPMGNVKVNGFKTKMAYNGGVAVEQPDVTLSCKLGKTTKNLVLGEDYTVSYQDNYDIGSATVIYEATESGEFAGKIIKNFSIAGKYTLDASSTGNAIVTLEDDSFEFTNAAIKPDVTVQAKLVNNAGVEEVRTLTQGKDYTVSYKNNKAVADATSTKAPQVVVKGKGDYKFVDTGDTKSGVTERFSITKAPLSSAVLSISDKPYSNKPNAYKSTKVLFTDHNYNDLRLKAGKDYTVDYTTSGGTDTPAAGETVNVTITATDSSSYTGSVMGSYRITGPTYGDITKAKIIVNPNAKGKATACAYTGSEIKPGQSGQPDLRILTTGKDAKQLKPGVDYEVVSYHNNVAPGQKATIVVRGIGEYRGLRAINFKISARSVSSHWGGIFGW